MNKKGRNKRKWHTGRLHLSGSRHRHDGDGRSEADRLTPLEETDEFKRSHQTEGGRAAADGTIRIDNKSVSMPEHLLDEDREGGSIFRVEPVVVFVLVVMLAFIAFVAWQVTLMPAKQ